jgi:hypothetical protein
MVEKSISLWLLAAGIWLSVTNLGLKASSQKRAASG